jgi:CO/xanthine dehydrogenase Mo-binding subunit
LGRRPREGRLKKGTQAAEVKVDKETSKVRVVRFVQIHGLGCTISEEMVIQDGKILNLLLTTYLMPMAADVPSKARMFAPVEA